MALIVQNFETQQGFILGEGYYKLDNITWDIAQNMVYCVLHLYASKQAAMNKKAFIPTETISYDFHLEEKPTDLIATCYEWINDIIAEYDEIETAIALYEANANNYEIIYDENGQEIGRELIPNDALYSQRFVLPSGFEQLRNAIEDNED